MEPCDSNEDTSGPRHTACNDGLGSDLLCPIARRVTWRLRRKRRHCYRTAPKKKAPLVMAFGKISVTSPFILSENSSTCHPLEPFSCAMSVEGLLYVVEGQLAHPELGEDSNLQ
jgi:hypothetical protein